MNDRTPPKHVYLTDDAIKALWAHNHHAVTHGTAGLALLYGIPSPLTVTLVVGEADITHERHKKTRQARKEALVVIGQSRAVTETASLNDLDHLDTDPRNVLDPPPLGHLFLVRHRIGPHNQFYATTYDGNTAVQVPIHRAKR